MAVLSPVAKQYFPNESGGPAAGYLLYTYATGTSTPQATYSNKAGTSANTNPIVLDARGEATIYLTPGTVYDYVLKTAEGVTVWTRTGVSSDEREYVSVKDFGAVGDGVTDDSAAVQLARAHAATVGGAIYYPPGSYYHGSAITGTNYVPVVGDGEGSTTLEWDFNGALFVFSQTALASYKTSGGFKAVGPGSTSTNTDSKLFHFNGTKGLTFCRFSGITMTSAHTFLRSDIPADAGSGQINWTTFENINLRSGVKYGAQFMFGSGTGNSWVGGKPAIGLAGGAVWECNGSGCDVGDILIEDVHCISETGEGAGVSTGVVFRGGADTTYRSRIKVTGQFDAQMDRPLDLSSTGDAWSNIKLVNSNIGGDVNIYDHIPPIARSIVDDQGVSVHRSQFNTTIAAGAGAVTDNLFQIEPAVSSGCEVKIVVTGVQGSEGPITVVRRWLLRRDSTSTTISSIETNSTGSTVPALTITPTDASGVVTFPLAYTAPASGTTSLDFQLIATGGTFKVQNGRHL